MNTAAERIEAAKEGIVYNARQCENALRMAAFAQDEPMLSPDVATGMRKLAAFHSEHAFRWVAILGHDTDGAA